MNSRLEAPCERQPSRCAQGSIQPWTLACWASACFGHQHVGHHGGGRHAQADLFLLEQHGFFAGISAVSSCGLGKRCTGRDMAQELHIGRQAHDMGLRQRRVQPRQSLARGWRRAR
jgi:hypothetical protein